MTKIAVQLPPYRNPGGVVPEQINVREVLSCWRTLFEPGKDLDRLYETLVTISAPAMARGFYRMRAHPNGRKLFENKPNILARLEDDDYLASLPAGTVGHAFRSFLATNRLDAGVLQRGCHSSHCPEEQLVRGLLLQRATGHGAP